MSFEDVTRSECRRHVGRPLLTAKDPLPNPRRPVQQIPGARVVNGEPTRAPCPDRGGAARFARTSVADPEATAGSPLGHRGLGLATRRFGLEGVGLLLADPSLVVREFRVPAQ